MGRRAWAAVLLAVLTVAVGALLAVPSAAPSAGSPDPVAGAQRITLGDRWYLLADVPGRLEPGRPPVVLALHGRTDDPARFLERTGLRALAFDGAAVVVAPATAPGLAVTSWNAGRCCDASREGVDDVSFLSTVVADAVARTGADPERVGVVGFSNGAMMGYRLACERASRLVALVAVGGPRVVEPCDPAEPVAVLHLHGETDTLIPLDGLAWSPLLRLQIPPAREAMSVFLDARLEVLPGVGHRWTRGGAGSPDVTALATRFLAEQGVLPAPAAAPEGSADSELS